MYLRVIGRKKDCNTQGGTVPSDVHLHELVLPVMKHAISLMEGLAVHISDSRDC